MEFSPDTIFISFSRADGCAFAAALDVGIIVRGIIVRHFFAPAAPVERPSVEPPP
jgi:hypothetical protein